ncbi:MAG: universal stress protein, partial [Flavobacterium sp.]
MKTLIVLNDHSTTACHAAIFALDLAQKINANLILASIMPPKQIMLPHDFADTKAGTMILQHSALLQSLCTKENKHSSFSPELEEIELSDFNDDELLKLTIEKNVYMVIKGIDEVHPSALLKLNLLMNTLMEKIKCPLLVIPASWNFKTFSKLVYFTDLRFCGLGVINFIAELAQHWNAKVLIAHASASGLPEIDKEQADAIFKEEIYNHLSYAKITMCKLEPDERPEAIK